MESTKRLGIAVSTRNRRAIYSETIRNIREKCKGFEIVVVDDASSSPVEDATFRFEKRAGIAKCKNKCLRLLLDRGCTDLFLFDDDIYPIREDWYLPYINSGHNHLCFTFHLDNKGVPYSDSVKLLNTHDGINYYSAPNGCMLYFKRVCMETVGGFDERFTVWGHEHVQLSHRIFNEGLIEHPFMDATNSLDHFYSMDYYGDIKSSVPNHIKRLHIEANTKLLEETKNMRLYVPIP